MSNFTILFIYYIYCLKIPSNEQDFLIIVKNNKIKHIIYQNTVGFSYASLASCLSSRQNGLVLKILLVQKKQSFEAKLEIGWKKKQKQQNKCTLMLIHRNEDFF